MGADFTGRHGMPPLFAPSQGARANFAAQRSPGGGGWGGGLALAEDEAPVLCSMTRHVGRLCPTIALARTFTYHAVAGGGGGCPLRIRHVRPLCATKPHEGELRPAGGMQRATVCPNIGHVGGSLPLYNATGQTSAQCRACRKSLPLHMGWYADHRACKHTSPHLMACG